MLPHPLQIDWLGRVLYGETLALQEAIVSQKQADPTLPDRLLTLEHEPVYTIGRTPDQTSLRSQPCLPHPVHVINRGGQATFHGPGQLVAYPLLDLRRYAQDLHRYLRLLEHTILHFCAGVGLEARLNPGQTGVWVGEEKLASIGVGVRRWISMHGIAINVRAAVDGFEHITPCGIAGVRMTSLEHHGINLSVQEAAAAFAASLQELLPSLVRRSEACR